MPGSNPLRRTVRVVDAVVTSHDGITLIEISTAVKLPLSTTHRIVNSLIDVGYLAVDAARKTYKIGERLKRVFLLTLGGAAIEQLARPLLTELSERFTETSYVVRLGTTGIELTDFYIPIRGPRTLVHPGYEFPMHASAAGKAIFAFQSEREIEAELSRGLKRYLPSTIVSAGELRAELARVRHRGYAVNNAELDAGVLALAAPLSIGDAGVAAALGIVGPRARILKRHKISVMGKALCVAASELSGLLVKKVARNPFESV